MRLSQANYTLHEDEKVILSKLCGQPWKKICIPGGVIQEKALIEPHIYSIPQLLIESNIIALILVDSKELEETELFRIAIEVDQKMVGKMISRTYPKFSELIEFPADLQIEKFLNIENTISIVRFLAEIETGKDGILGKVIVDSGLLISNKNGRMILYPSPVVPLDICISTNEFKISNILSRAICIECQAP